MNTEPSKFTDEQVEKLLRALPRYERSPRAEKKFFAQFEQAVREKNSAANIAAPRFSFLKFATSFGLTILVLATGVTFASYQPSVTRGTLFYPWKKTVEKVELAFAFSPLKQVDTHLDFSDRRLGEANEILDVNPGLAFFVEAAQAHEEEIHLDTDEAVYFALTLSEMRHEVALASEIVENKFSIPTLAKAALEKIETVVEEQVSALEDLENETPEEVKVVVRKIAQESDEHVALVVEAKEEAEEAVIASVSRIEVRVFKRIGDASGFTTDTLKENTGLAKGTGAQGIRAFEPTGENTVPETIGANKPAEEKTAEVTGISSQAAQPAVAKLEDRKEKAKLELQKAVEVYVQLPSSEKKQFEEKVEMATQALQEGKYGRTTGLSRSLQHRIEKIIPDDLKTPEEFSPYKSEIFIPKKREIFLPLREKKTDAPEWVPPVKPEIPKTWDELAPNTTLPTIEESKTSSEDVEKKPNIAPMDGLPDNLQSIEVKPRNTINPNKIEVKAAPSGGALLPPIKRTELQPTSVVNKTGTIIIKDLTPLTRTEKSTGYSLGNQLPSKTPTNPQPLEYQKRSKDLPVK